MTSKRMGSRSGGRITDSQAFVDAQYHPMHILGSTENIQVGCPRVAITSLNIVNYGELL